MKSIDTGRSFGILILLACGPWLSSCSGPPVTTSLSGEPVCPDYELGATRTKMQGGLRFPVMLTITEGSTPVLKTMILGRRSDQDQMTRILLTDSNDKYTVEFAQCENERAPRPVTGRSETKEAARYECGSASAYSTITLETKKGDLSTHALAFAAPPKPECWMTDVPAAAKADAADAGADAGGADAGQDAGEASADAGDADAGQAADAGDADAGQDAGSNPDAGSAKDAGKGEDGKKKGAAKP